MSLINQMLKDIDERGRDNARAGRSTSVYEAGRKPLAPWLFVLIGVLSSVVVVLIVLLVLRTLNGNGQNAEVVQVQQTPVANEQGLEVSNANADAAEVEVSTSEPQSASVRQFTRPVPPLVRAQEPSAGEQEPSAGEQQPSARQQEPSAGEQELSAAQQEPSARQQEPSAAEQQPAGEMTIERSSTNPAELASRQFDRGMRALEAGRTREAQERFQEALLLQPRFVEAREQLAVLYFSQGFLSDALRVLEQGLNISPNEERFLLLQARLLERSDQAALALEVLRPLPIRLPQYADALILRGALATDEGDFELAITTYEGLVAWRAQEGRWWLGLGIAYEQNQQPEEAVRAYMQALNDNRLTQASRNFIQQRLEAL
ncbi:tetratricopeptide repeat protein [Aliidiomarina celeris]|uniref:tetratricopeptide repeat protein n=1 Tax=Aliidiomarina celeris TaxID=2249428 RepID=UPI000DE95F2E|nr:tetratricopeptide repeat protein [Aliidiomarina celeris]